MKPKYISARDYVEKYHAGRKPSLITVRRWIESKAIAGKKIGGRWFVDENRLTLTGNPLVDKVLSA